MLDRQKLETLLARRFPGATMQQFAAAANAIMAMASESAPPPHDEGEAEDDPDFAPRDFPAHSAK